MDYFIIDFNIPGEPKSKGRPRFTKTGYKYTPEETASYENLVKLCYQKAAEKYTNKKMIPADVPIRVYISAYFMIPKSFSAKKRRMALNREIFPTKKPDGDNIIKTICDAMNGIAYADDKQIVQVTCTKRYAEEPYVHVLIEEY